MVVPPPGLEPEIDPADRARVRRAVVLVAISLLVAAGAGLWYLHPSLGIAAHPESSAPVLQSSYSLAAIDFVDPSTGWVVATFDDGGYMIMSTADSGRTWTPQLSGPTNGHGVYLKFFDRLDGVFALTGARPLMDRTTDGGATWTPHPAVSASSSVLAYSFADAANGWMLVHVDPQSPGDTHLYRTVDAGVTWVDLGRPVRAPDQAYSVAFGVGGGGWLATLSSGPYAYRSNDYGETWSKVSLPIGHGWPVHAQYLVSAEPVGSGVVASIVAFAPTSGRSGIGATILDYPPLKVRAFDGGVPVTYFYGVATDTMMWRSTGLTGSATEQVQAPNQEQVFSIDGGDSWTGVNLPTDAGAIGVLDTWDWWWIGSGHWSVTVDAGHTWSAPRSIVIPEPLAGSLQVIDQKHAWYAAMIGSRPTLVTTSDSGASWRTIQLPPMTRGV